MENLANRFPAAEINFVLGDHDFFGSSFAETDRQMAELCRKSGNLYHLAGDTIVPLSDDTALIGHRGWGDAGAGWGAKTWLANPDFGQIQDFCHLSKTRRFEKLHQLGAESAAALRAVLPYALKCYRRVIISTHVPHITESALFNNKPCWPTLQPFLVNASLGCLIYRMAGLHPRCQMTVLAGHTHSPVSVDIKDNLRVRVGAGRTGGAFYTMLADANLALRS